jgi:molybdopterin-guanine dinucleotide biosynthesis protein A
VDKHCSRDRLNSRETGAEEVFICGRKDTDYSAIGCRVLHDKFADAGALAGIERALDATTSSLLLVLAVDLPAMNAAFLRQLAAGCSGKHGAIPKLSGYIEPLAAFYPKSAYALVVSQLEGGSFAVKNFAAQCVQSHLARFVELEADAARYFVNWNSPADLPCPT